MKRCIFTAVCCAAAFTSIRLLAADSIEEEYPEGSLCEDKQVALLLQASEHTCAELKALQADLAAFRAQEASCIQSPNTEALYKLSECAMKLVNGIHQTHVEPYFRPAFLEELERISKTAKNRSFPPICTP